MRSITKSPFPANSPALLESTDRPCILVIEDHEAFRLFTCESLQLGGFETRTAASAEQGLESALAFPPDLILSDIKMTGNDGFQLLQRFRSNPKTATIPVILMSGNLRCSSESDRRRAMALGADDFLRKPFAMEALLSSVRSRLQKKVLESEQANRAQACLVQILESAIDLTVLVDAKSLQVVYLNQAGRQFFGVPPTQELKEHSLASICSASSLCELVDQTFPAVQDGATWQGELTLRRADDREVPARAIILGHVVSDYDGRIYSIVAHDISQRREADSTIHLAHAALDAAANAVAITDVRGLIIWVNQAFTSLTGYSAAEAIGQTPRILSSKQHEREFYRNMWRTISSGQIWHGELCNRRKDGTLYHEEMTITPVRQNGKVTHFIAIKLDIAARKQAEEERRLLEVKLRQAQKLESIGQLAAGIAHEINTPIQFVGDNVRFVDSALPHFARLVERHKELIAAARAAPATAALAEAAEAELMAGELDYLTKELPNAMKESIDGIDRVASIVRAMKEFSHPNSKSRTPLNLNRAIESTAAVARNEWKYVADLVLDLDPKLPPVPCYAGEINQVILNLIVNSAHSIAEVVRARSGTKGTISLRTRQVEDMVEVQVSDTGAGIPEAIRHRVYDPFFTTKDVGKGTGQGLTMAHNTIVIRHGGSLRFESAVGQGTTFFVRLPLNPPSEKDLLVEGTPTL